MDNKECISKIQTLLLISNKPVKFKELAKSLGITETRVKDYLAELKDKFNKPESGWWVVETNDAAQLASNPTQSKFIEDYLEVEQLAELTQPALEALTIISYCGPIAKFTLDRIRGVNCALIIRNLMIKGLVEEVKNEKEKSYQVTMDFVKHLGIGDITELSDYDKLHDHEYINEFLPESEVVAAAAAD